MRIQLLLTESEGGTMEIILFTPSLPSPLPSSLRTVFFDRLVIYITLIEYRKHVFKAKISLEKANGRSVIKKKLAVLLHSNFADVCIKRITCIYFQYW